MNLDSADLFVIAAFLLLGPLVAAVKETRSNRQRRQAEKGTAQ